MEGGRRDAAVLAPSRDWSELPIDALSYVFAKLHAFDVLMGAGLVCHSWLDAAELPNLWRSVDMANHKVLRQTTNPESLCAMAKVAVDRSGGQLEAFVGEYFVTPELLEYIGDRAPSLKRLSLICCLQVSDGRFVKAVKKFPFLDEIELSQGTFVTEMDVFEIAKSCPHLKIFRMNERGYLGFDDCTEKKALGISTMVELQHLQLFGSRLTNEVLMTILDNCPDLESLDIRHCFNVKMDDLLQGKCARLNTVRLPHDPTDDYPWPYPVEAPIWDDYDEPFDDPTSPYFI